MKTRAAVAFEAGKPLEALVYTVPSSCFIFALLFDYNYNTVIACSVHLQLIIVLFDVFDIKKSAAADSIWIQRSLDVIKSV